MMLNHLLKSTVRRIRCDRTTQALLWGGVLILLTGLSPRSYRQIGNSADFWYTKLNWRHCADVVLAGDSRTYRGLSPRHMSPAMPNRRILNFGFSGTGFSDEYLSAIEQVLDSHSHERAIVLGITPQSLTLTAASKNQFVELLSTNRPINLVKAKYLGRFSQFVLPFGVDSVALPPSTRRPNTDEFHPDGWVASVRTAHLPERELPAYREFFASNQVDERIIASLLLRVSRWTTEGIRVYAFRPPTTERMCAVENQLSGFDEGAFRRRFRSVGGFWIDVDASGLRSYDGSHIDRDSAIQLSSDVASHLVEADAKAVAQRPGTVR